MLDINKIIADLEQIKKYPGMYIQPATPESLRSYFNGFYRALSFTQLVDMEIIREVSRAAIRKRGFPDDAGNPFRNLSKKGFSDEQIIQEILDVEVEMWKSIREKLNG